MDIKNAKSELNKVDKIILGVIKSDPTLNDYLAMRREQFGIPVGGFDRYETIKDKKTDYNKLANEMLSTIKVIRVCYNLSDRWNTVLLNYILFSEITEPDSNVVFEPTENGFLLIVQDWANDPRIMNQFLAKNGIFNVKTKEFLKNTSKNLKNYALDLRIMQLKEERLSSAAIADCLRKEFGVENLPKEFIPEFDDHAKQNGMSAEDYIDNTYSKLNKTLRKIKIKPERPIYSTDMALRRIGKI